MNNDLARFKDLYFETAKEQIKILNENLTHYTNTDDKEIVNKIFIAAHSLKGQSLMMGYEKVGLAAKLIEKIFRDIKEGITQKKTININLITSTINKISIWLDTHDSANLEPELDQEITELEKMLI